MICKYDFTSSTTQADCGCTYWFNPNSLTRLFCQPLPSRAADLLDVLMTFYTADRLSRRDFRGANTGQRHIHVKLGVRDPELWNESKMVAKCQEFLYWLSEDVWSFHFIRRQAAPYSAELNRFLFRLPLEHPVTVSLFSGGLDSLAGLATHMQDNNSGSHILVSGYTHNRLAERQRVQIKHIPTIDVWQGLIKCHAYSVPYWSPFRLTQTYWTTGRKRATHSWASFSRIWSSCGIASWGRYLMGLRKRHWSDEPSLK